MKIRHLWAGVLTPLVAVSLFGASLSLAAVTLRPVGEVETIPIGRTAKPYLVIGEEAVVIPVVGPGTVTFFARVPMPTDAAVNRQGVLVIDGLDIPEQKLALEFRPSRSGSPQRSMSVG